MNGMKRFWSGPLARLDSMAQRRRIVAADGFTSRSVPMPLLWQRETSTQGHAGSVVVGRVLGVVRAGNTVHGWGDWMDPEVIPEVAQAYMLAEQGVVSPSLDPGDYTMEVDSSEGPDVEPILRMSSYQMAGVSLVPMAAFDGHRLVMEDSPPGPEGHVGYQVDALLAAARPKVDPAVVHKYLSENYPASTLGWVKDAQWAGPMAVKLADIDMARRSGGAREPDKVKGIAEAIRSGETMDPIVLVRTPGQGKLQVADGYHRTLGGKHAGLDKMSAYVGTVDSDEGPWDSEMHEKKLNKGPESRPDDADMSVEHDDDLAVLAINLTGWQGLPIAPRRQPFDADDAIARILAWAGEDTGKASRAFLWSSPAAAVDTRERYRLPIGDIINGQLTVVYHAVYAGAALINGAHGGLPGLSEPDRARLRGIITRIYAAMARAFSDPHLRAPWEAGGNGRVGGKVTMGVDVDEPGLTAAGGPLAPPQAWFGNPGFDAPTPMRIDGAGRVWGHLALWDVCHLTVGRGGCVTPPRSAAGYAFFNAGEVLTAEGEFVAVGKITLGTGHADVHHGYLPALAHYDNTGTAAATVRAGEDEYGIWVAGSVLPEVDEAQVAELRRSPLSGDWRRISGNLELVAALAVNVPAFPVARVESGRQTSLVAAGALAIVGPPDVPLHGDVIDMGELVREVAANLRVRGEREERLATLHTVDQYDRAKRLQVLKGG